jgi:dihydrofolate synthase/folylpolyglutamate synthase
MPAAKTLEYNRVDAALDAALEHAAADDRILAFGSFFVAAPALEWARRTGFA